MAGQRLPLLIIALLLVLGAGCQRGSNPSKAVGAGDGSAKGQEVWTADLIEENLKALGFSIPNSGLKLADGVGQRSSIPRPIGAPKKKTGDSFATYMYECKHEKTGAVIEGTIEEGRFLYFAGQSRESGKAMHDLLKRLDPTLAEKCDKEAKELEKSQENGSVIRLKDAKVVLTKKGTVLMSNEEPTVFESEGAKYGLIGVKR